MFGLRCLKSFSGLWSENFLRSFLGFGLRFFKMFEDVLEIF